MSVDDALQKNTLKWALKPSFNFLAQEGMLNGPIARRKCKLLENPKSNHRGGRHRHIGDLAAQKKSARRRVIGKALYEGRFTLKEALTTIGA
jgi:phosphoribosylformimino-5-aminoimidazole carboxamide ribonucleotide (ProFAR) isomerase